MSSYGEDSPQVMKLEDFSLFPLTRHLVLLDPVEVPETPGSLWPCWGGLGLVGFSQFPSNERGKIFVI